MRAAASAHGGALQTFQRALAAMSHMWSVNPCRLGTSHATIASCPGTAARLSWGLRRHPLSSSLSHSHPFPNDRLTDRPTILSLVQTSLPSHFIPLFAPTRCYYLTAVHTLATSNKYHRQHQSSRRPVNAPDASHHPSPMYNMIHCSLHNTICTAGKLQFVFAHSFMT